MKLILQIIFILLLSIGMFSVGRYSLNITGKLKTNVSNVTPDSPARVKPLEIYTIDNLTKAEIKNGNFHVENKIATNPIYNSHDFIFQFYPNPEKLYKKTTTGMINIPNSSKKYPVIIMLRGYVDQEIYKTGMGTVRASEVFAKNGFITIAPDFLGYADSDTEADNIFESRFQSYTTALSLIKSLHQISKWDGNNIFLWGHSNGGQIALTILEITQANYPTTLWAPVSKPFPYSILYYTDEAEDKGKLIRTELAKFEKDYNVSLYSLDNYLERIDTPIQIHQGSADDAVPANWTNSLVDTLTNLNLDIDYFIYPGADHNMRPFWDDVVEKDIQYFTNNIK